MKTKLILCFTLFTAALIGVSCGEASAQSEKGGHNKLADKDHHHDKDHHDKDHHECLHILLSIEPGSNLDSLLVIRIFYFLVAYVRI